MLSHTFSKGVLSIRKSYNLTKSFRVYIKSVNLERVAFNEYTLIPDIFNCVIAEPEILTEYIMVFFDKSNEVKGVEATLKNINFGKLTKLKSLIERLLIVFIGRPSKEIAIKLGLLLKSKSVIEVKETSMFIKLGLLLKSIFSMGLPERFNVERFQTILSQLSYYFQALIEKDSNYRKHQDTSIDYFLHKDDKAKVYE